MDTAISDHDRFPGDSQRFRADLARWYRKNARALPWRNTRDPYRILVSEMMLQQTTVAAVVPKYLAWIDRFPTVEALARSTEQEALHAWQGLGYYSRARNLRLAADAITTRHGGRFPRDPAGLARLPGIGAYTAAAVASLAFRRPVPAVDANVVRVIARLTDFPSRVDTAAGRGLITRIAADLVDRRHPDRHNNAMMELGALVCLPDRPDCPRCPVRSHCLARDPATLPLRPPRQPVTRQRARHAWITRDGHILLEHSSGPRWKGLWILPAIPGDSPPGHALAQVIFPITRHHITMTVHPMPAPQRAEPPLAWWAIDRIASCPMPSPHRRAVENALGHLEKNTARMTPAPTGGGRRREPPPS